MGIEVFMETRPLWKAAMGVCTLGFILFCTGFGSTYWFSVTVSEGGISITSHQGLFQACNDLIGCLTFTDSPGWFYATQVLCSMGLFWYVVGGVFAILAVLWHRPRTARIAAYFIVKCAAFGIAGAAVYVAQIDASVNIGWSAIIFFVACGFALISGILQFVDAANDSSGQPGAPMYKF